MLEKTEGMIQNIAGKVQDAVGGATGDLEIQTQGKVRQAAGKVEEIYGDAIGGIRDAATTNPITTLAVVAGASFLLGALWSSRRGLT